MVKLNKIYTRTGDDGMTGLATGDRRLKSDLRLEAIGTVDELNGAIGVARLAISGEADAMLSRIQNVVQDSKNGNPTIDDRGVIDFVNRCGVDGHEEWEPGDCQQTLLQLKRTISSPSKHPDDREKQECDGVIDASPNLSKLEETFPFPAQDIRIVDA